MTTVKKVLDIAKSEIGYKEKAGNNNKFGQALGLNYGSWCALFLLDSLIKSGFTGYKKLAISYAYCPTWWNAFKQQKLNVKVPKSGDIVFYAWTAENVRNEIPYHVGIVESVKTNGDIISIEGNTGDPSLNQGEGDGVYRKLRNRSFVVGFGRPPYTN